MAKNLNGKKVAILATNGFEQSELIEPKKALENAGATVEIISPDPGSIVGWNHKNWGQTIAVDKTLSECNPDDYDALMLPGGVMNPDTLRQDNRAVAFTRRFFEQHKPVGAICHGPWMLVEADVIKNRSLTSYPSIKTDIENAGGKWQDAEVVVDQGLVTSRKPDDLPRFNSKLIEEIAEGKHQKQTASAGTANR